VASPEWAQKIAAIAKRHGALLIIDDVQAGCGRTGTFFSFEPLGINPDIVVMSKSISGFGLPMAIVLIKPEYDLWEPAEHNGTFRGNTHAFVTGNVMLEKFWSDDAFSKEVMEKAEIVTDRLKSISRLIPGSHLKGRGMMQGLNVGTGELADKICRKAFEKGLIIETSGPHDEVVKILAPLTTPVGVLEDGLAIIERAVNDVMGLTVVPSVVSIHRNAQKKNKDALYSAAWPTTQIIKVDGYDNGSPPV